MVVLTGMNKKTSLTESCFGFYSRFLTVAEPSAAFLQTHLITLFISGLFWVKCCFIFNFSGMLGWFEICLRTCGWLYVGSPAPLDGSKLAAHPSTVTMLVLGFF